MSKLLIATNNKGKVDELRDLLKDIGIDLLTPAQINLQLDVAEDGKTYAENATKKAIAFAQASGLISLADDSGLELDALAGAPGLYSARYGPPLSLPPLFAKHPHRGQIMGGAGGESDADRRQYLLQNLQGKPRPWWAHFHATIAVATPGGEVHLTEGICEGEIIPEERGTGGFGYDPIFLFPDLGRTMAQLSMDEKNRLSHRARAVMNAKPILAEIFNSE